MTTECPAVVQNGRYSVTEAAKALGCTRQTINAKVRDGILRCGYRRTNGRKFFLGSEIIRYWKSEM